MGERSLHFHLNRNTHGKLPPCTPARKRIEGIMAILRVQDLRVAARMVAKNPAAALLSVLSIALGIGLTTGVFRLADALLLRPLAIDRPAEVFEAGSIGDDGSHFMYGWPDYEDM